MMTVRAVHRNRRPPRGSAYVLILTSAMVVTLMGLAALTAVRLQLRGAVDTADVGQARLNALTAIEIGLLTLNGDPDWRSNFSSGNWITDQSNGDGAFSLDVIDPNDGDFRTYVCGPVEMIGIGDHGQAHYEYRVLLESDGWDADTYHDAVTDLGPVSYWRLGESEGTEAFDEMEVQHGEYINGVSLGAPSPFRCDRVADFDGANDHVWVPHHDAYHARNGTVTLWFHADDVTKAQGLVSKDAVGRGTGGHFSVWVIGGRARARLQDTQNSFQIESASILLSNEWYHVAFVFGEQGMRLYVNGQLVASDTYDGGTDESSGGLGNFEPMAFGVSLADMMATGAPRRDPFAGLIDEVAFFDRALSPVEIRVLYRAGSVDLPYTMQPATGSWHQAVGAVPEPAAAAAAQKAAKVK